MIADCYLVQYYYWYGFCIDNPYLDHDEALEGVLLPRLEDRLCQDDTTPANLRERVSNISGGRTEP